MLVENKEQIEKLKNDRKKQLSNWQMKKSEKSVQVEKKSEEIQVISKTSTKEDRTRSSKVTEVKEVSKIMTRHSDVNGHASSNKHKNIFKRKMST
jgi:hypothetical protein